MPQFIDKLGLDPEHSVLVLSNEPEIHLGRLMNSFNFFTDGFFEIFPKSYARERAKKTLLKIQAAKPGVTLVREGSTSIYQTVAEFRSFAGILLEPDWPWAGWSMGAGFTSAASYGAYNLVNAVNAPESEGFEQALLAVGLIVPTTLAFYGAHWILRERSFLSFLEEVLVAIEQGEKAPLYFGKNGTTKYKTITHQLDAAFMWNEQDTPVLLIRVDKK